MQTRRTERKAGRNWPREFSLARRQSIAVKVRGRYGAWWKPSESHVVRRTTRPV